MRLRRSDCILPGGERRRRWRALLVACRRVTNEQPSPYTRGTLVWDHDQGQAREWIYWAACRATPRGRAALQDRLPTEGWLAYVAPTVPQELPGTPASE